MIKISNDIKKDIELIKFMMKNENLSSTTLKFLMNYLIQEIEKK
jgi:hypothetical protein